MTTIGWVSGGITSAVACYMLRSSIDEFVYIDTGSEHPDTARFLRDLEALYGKKILVLRSKDHPNIWDVFEKRRFIKSPFGAPCTMKLKREVREAYCKGKDITHVWGFTADETARISKILKLPGSHLVPLLDAGYTKQMCMDFAVQALKLDVPTMYKLGFPNNNCVGCVKGGAGYWNLIRVHFPEIFQRMAALEQDIGAAILRKDGSKLYLKDLPPTMGRNKPIHIADCGATGEVCEIQLSREFHADTLDLD